MRLRVVTISNRRGLHARAAAQFVKLTESFDATVVVECRGIRVPASSIMGLMMLAASQGIPLTLHGKGLEAEQALDALCSLIDNRFNEQD